MYMYLSSQLERCSGRSCARSDWRRSGFGRRVSSVCGEYVEQRLFVESVIYLKYMAPFYYAVQLWDLRVCLTSIQATHSTTCTDTKVYVISYELEIRRRTRSETVQRRRRISTTIETASPVSTNKNTSPGRSKSEEWVIPRSPSTVDMITCQTLAQSVTAHQPKWLPDVTLRLNKNIEVSLSELSTNQFHSRWFKVELKICIVASSPVYFAVKTMY